MAPLLERSLRTATWMFADDLGIVARAPHELVAAVAADPRRTVFVVPELHGAYEPVDIVEHLLLPLLALPQVRMVIETRTDVPCTEVLIGSVAAPAVMDLADPRWTDRAGFDRWAASIRPTTAEANPNLVDVIDCYPSPGRALGWAPVPTAAPVLPSFDVDTLLAAEPHRVAAWLEEAERTGGHVGELGRAWIRAGQSLHLAQPRASRALVLLAALGSGGAAAAGEALDVRARLAEHAASGPWQVVWSTTRDDDGPGWPGPVAALAPGTAQRRGQVLIAGVSGDLRVIPAQGGVPQARLAADTTGTPLAVFGLPDGTVVVLDEWGRDHTVGEASYPVGGGLRGLLDAAVDEWKPLRDALLEFPGSVPGDARLTAACAVQGGAAFGDETGRVHVLIRQPSEHPGPPDVLTRQVHEGPVTALASLTLAADDGAEGPCLVYSGGTDGNVHVWGLGSEPLEVPVQARPYPVTALSADDGAVLGAAIAVAWADGLVRHEVLDPGSDHAEFHTAVRELRPGPPVRALCCLDRYVVIGTDEMTVVMEPR
ncbi:hypothetical protein HW130_24650 [Streptomyces sp. PKU-EA00015]|uniref:hypothetical protein n=1 Tax=Streptomyces sp. PKU-EA00015 TaxID=2748326 RepID=UPI0015A4D88B|nr:hypothetical protein [Streptomyces sp. PKU-EA00015]NWF29408.1 hypothetical protein [Streptomyces sp. PKU-EA00015]